MTVLTPAPSSKERENRFAFGFVTIRVIRVKSLRPLLSMVPHCGTKEDWRLGGSNSQEALSALPLKIHAWDLPDV